MSQFNAQTYSVEKTTGHCAFTERVLEPHEQYIATLIEEGDELKRIDISAEAWDEGKRPENLFSHWKAIVPEPNEKKKVFVDDEVLLNLHARLADAEQPQRIAFRFVLTLILMRKKMLRYDKTIQRGGTATNEAGEETPVTLDYWQLVPKLNPAKGPMSKWDNDTIIEVLDPSLDADGIRAVTDQLSEILESEL